MQQQEQQENYYQILKFKWTQFNKIYCIPEYSSSSISSHRRSMRRPKSPMYLTSEGTEDENLIDIYIDNFFLKHKIHHNQTEKVNTKLSLSFCFLTHTQYTHTHRMKKKITENLTFNEDYNTKKGNLMLKKKFESLIT